jgi:hypothetical protein
MGLGETIQTISLLAHLACEKGKGLVSPGFFLCGTGSKIFVAGCSIEEENYR